MSNVLESLFSDPGREQLGISATGKFFVELRWGWVFLERTRILSGIQFRTYFIEIFVVETK